jgi:hypothetical protein
MTEPVLRHIRGCREFVLGSFAGRAGAHVNAALRHILAVGAVAVATTCFYARTVRLIFSALA